MPRQENNYYKIQLLSMVDGAQPLNITIVRGERNTAASLLFFLQGVFVGKFRCTQLKLVISSAKVAVFIMPLQADMVGTQHAGTATTIPMLHGCMVADQCLQTGNDKH